MTDTPARVLHSVRAKRLTAAEALTWFISSGPASGSPVGYALSPMAASWMVVRPGCGLDTDPSHPEPLGSAYEVRLFDGLRELRWLRTPDGAGIAVALGEDERSLPHGVESAIRPRRARTHRRMLAGSPRRHSDLPGWTTLVSAQYSPAHLPVECPRDDRILVIETVEYLTEDGYGNVDVRDTRTVGLRAVPRDSLRRQSPERSAQ